MTKLMISSNEFEKFSEISINLLFRLIVDIHSQILVEIRIRGWLICCNIDNTRSTVGFQEKLTSRKFCVSKIKIRFYSMRWYEWIQSYRLLEMNLLDMNVSQENICMWIILYDVTSLFGNYDQPMNRIYGYEARH